MGEGELGGWPCAPTSSGGLASVEALLFALRLDSIERGDSDEFVDRSSPRAARARSTHAQVYSPAVTIPALDSGMEGQHSSPMGDSATGPVQGTLPCPISTTGECSRNLLPHIVEKVLIHARQEPQQDSRIDLPRYLRVDQHAAQP